MLRLFYAVWVAKRCKAGCQENIGGAKSLPEGREKNKNNTAWISLSLSITELYFYLHLGSKIETYFCLFLYFFYIVIYQAIVRPTDDCLVYFYYLFISLLWVFFVHVWEPSMFTDKPASYIKIK